MLLFLIPFVFSEAPPALPMEIWGLASEDGNPVTDGLSVEASINGQNYARVSVTDSGYYDVIISGLDRPLTYIDDPNCATHWGAGDACVQCSTNPIDSDYCIEGPQEGDAIGIEIDGSEVEQNFALSSGSIVNQDVTIVTIVIFTKDLVPGWNLFSLPVQPAGTSIDEVLSSIAGKYSIVWSTDNGVWQSNKDFFGALTTVTPDKSYRIYMNSAGTLSVSGNKIDYQVITVSPGWNLIGYPSLSVRDLSSVLAGKDYGIVWTTDNGVWQSDKDFFGALTQFNPGQGYRIYANTPFSIEIQNS